jgi:putative flippase GtrA
MTRLFTTYILVGILNTAFGYTLFALFIFLRFPDSLAVLLATLAGVAFNFRTIGKMVFKSNDNSAIIRFLLVYGMTYLLNVAGLRVLAALYHLSMYRAGAVLLLPMALISFLLHKGFVFRKPQKVAAHAAY